MKKNTAIIKRRLQRLREITAKSKSPLSGMTEEEIIEKLRKDRERLWEEKLAARS